MLFSYVQIKDRHDPGVNIREKASIASVNEAGGSSREGLGGVGRGREGGRGALILLAEILGS